MAACGEGWWRGCLQLDPARDCGPHAWLWRFLLAVEPTSPELLTQYTLLWCARCMMETSHHARPISPSTSHTPAVKRSPAYSLWNPCAPTPC